MCQSSQIAGKAAQCTNAFVKKAAPIIESAAVDPFIYGITAFVSIMRGCDNMCTFCVVPFTRGRERSRNAASIVEECKDLYKKGYKEVTLLGQNVDSYRWSDDPELRGRALKEAPRDEVIDFAKLLIMVAEIAPDLRVRFSTSHPKDIIDEVLFAIRDCKNICNYIHLPAQSGNTRILKKMNRTYTREWYNDKVARIKEVIPNCAISTDIITGFCWKRTRNMQIPLI